METKHTKDQSECDCGGGLEYHAEDEEGHSIYQCVKCGKSWFDEHEL